MDLQIAGIQHFRHLVNVILSSNELISGGRAHPPAELGRKTWNSFPERNTFLGLRGREATGQKPEFYRSGLLVHRPNSLEPYRSTTDAFKFN